MIKNLTIFTLVSCFSVSVFAQKTVKITTTAKDTTLRFSYTGQATFQSHDQALERETTVFVDSKKTFQTFEGIGGAMTDASAETIAKLPVAKQAEIMDAFYDKDKGLNYHILRTNIHSCDFSSGSYTYIDEGDKELKTFSIAHDQQFKIPMIKRALVKNPKLKIFASPWSPPAFMKTNNSMLKGGKLKPEFNQSWANYFVKFIQAFQKEGIPIWGLTIQNEPMATQTWESCIFTATEERDFLKKFLGPTLAKAKFNDKKVIIWDHNRDLIYQYASTILNDPEARKFVWGVGFHWYENWSGGEQMFGNVDLVSKNYRDTKLIFTEGCAESFRPEKINDWALGEFYAKNMMEDFNAGTVAWTDWNVVLDERGGPNHVGNFCMAPVHINTQTGEILYTNSYYYIGHFSKYIQPGAKRILNYTSRSSLKATAFKNPNGKHIVVVLNTSGVAQDYFLWENHQAASIHIPAHAIQTLEY